MLSARSFFLALLVACADQLPAQEAAPAPAPAMEEISPGVFRIGKLRLDKIRRSITFPGRINQDKDLIEYVLVTPNGPTHESLLTSEVQPTDLHFAMLLIGAKGAGLLAPQPGDAPPGQVDAIYLKTAPRLKGDNLTFGVKWKDKDGKEQTAQVEDWMVNAETNKPVPRGPWIYSGSMFGADGGFLAQQEGMFASAITNPAALINNPRTGNDNDKVWAVNDKAVPPVDTPIEIILTITEGTSETK